MTEAKPRAVAVAGPHPEKTAFTELPGKTLKVALLGCGVVGTQVARLLREEAAELAVRSGAQLEIAGIAVRRLSHPRPGIDRDLLTTDAIGLATRPDVDIVVEVIGGIEPAHSLILAAMKSGKSVVSANKALLAEHGEQIHRVSRDYGADLYYEAAVAGAIPILRPLRESLAGDTVHRVMGIVNGTTNFILDRMDSSGADFAESLEEAQALGYAEPDPTADVEGFDAVFVDAKSAGQLMFYGAGAGGTPTASAVLGDLVAVARNRLAGTKGPEVTTYAELPVLPMGDTLTRYHVSLDVADKPGVLAPVAEAFARHGVSIQAVRQTSRGTEALLVIVTHVARDADLAATISELQALPVVRAVASVMRVEGEEDQ
jgi:homoserine dehydrogenase/predicted amino acid-binding ACT domain protein